MPITERILEQFERLRARPAVLGLVGVLILGGISAGGYYAYRTYDYVQHDNDFCMSCHLMADPYEQFAESAHRGLGCKACHQPNMIERSSMAMAQIIENPDEIRVHAEVPNERCVTCHVEGDPEEWRSIAQSAGHRTHLESTDSTLVDVSCVECHSTSVHQFAPIDDTCGQSGCHTDNAVNLGNMSDLTIHCVACHNFNVPVDPVTAAELASQALSPAASECMSCHVMRTLAQMPENDPHEQLCASCHNPHEQETPADAVQSCAIGGCHDDMQELTPFHLGLHQETMDDCTACHSAHDFSLSGDDCLSCHEDIFDDAGTTFQTEGRTGSVHPDIGGTRVAMSVGAVPPSVRRRLAGSAPAVWTDPVRGAKGNPHAYALTLGSPSNSQSPHGLVPAAHAAAGVELTPPTPTAAAEIPPPATDTVTFRHGEHREVDCASCHSSSESHGGLTVSGVQDCRSCHHTEPVKDDCRSCHEEAGRFEPPSGLSRLHTMDFQVKAPTDRELPFDHGAHESEDCASCHEDDSGATLSAAGSSCSGCHTEHHEVTAQVTCRSCHVPAPVEEHPVSEVHVTCAGSSCHAESSLDNIPRAREFCLACHQDMVDHKLEEDRTCAACHTLPAPRNAGG